MTNAEIAKALTEGAAFHRVAASAAWPWSRKRHYHTGKAEGLEVAARTLRENDDPNHWSNVLSKAFSAPLPNLENGR